MEISTKLSESDTINSNFPFLVLFRICGLTYSDIRYTSMSKLKIKEYKSQISIISIGHFLLMLTVVVYFFVQFFLTIHIVDKDAASTVANHVIRKAYAFEVLLLSAIIVLQTFFTSETEYKIILMINLFDSFLSSNISYKFNNKRFTRKFAIKLCIMFVVFGFLYGMILYLSFPRDSDIIFASILMQLTVTKFVFHVDLVRFRLQNMAKILKNELKKEMSFEEFIDNLLKDNPVPADYSSVKHNISVVEKGFSILADTAGLIDYCYSWIMLMLYIIIFSGN